MFILAYLDPDSKEIEIKTFDDYMGVQAYLEILQIEKFRVISMEFN